MTYIRRDQWLSMARRNFLGRIEALIRVNLPAEAVQKLNVPQIAEHCLNTAQSYTLNEERPIVGFVLHMLNINPEFHRQSSINAILDDRSVDDSNRMERLLTDTAESDWEEAVTMCDPTIYWLPFINPVLTS
jgi:hypothetical protein